MVAVAGAFDAFGVSCAVPPVAAEGERDPLFTGTIDVWGDVPEEATLGVSVLDAGMLVLDGVSPHATSKILARHHIQ
jgi:hypothetical protein